MFGLLLVKLDAGPQAFVAFGLVIVAQALHGQQSCGLRSWEVVVLVQEQHAFVLQLAASFRQGYAIIASARHPTT